MPDDVLPMARFILEMKSPFIEFLGLGATLACCCGTLPDEQNLGLIEELANETERQTGHQVRTVSIGGSVILPWIEQGLLPSRINQARIGEATLLRNTPSTDQRHEALHPDVFVLRGTVLEVKEKPSKPTGRQGTDVFGQGLNFANHGLRLRCILDFGIVDTYPKGLVSASDDLEFINSNSDYTVVDATGVERALRPGDWFDFHLNYQALIRAFHAPHLTITVTGHEEAIYGGHEGRIP
jgi:predicted amino acid racemase